MLRHRVEALGLDVRVRSAGLLDNGHPAHSNSIDVLTGRGLDITRHRSRRITAAILRSADLILAMARDHVREAVVMAPDVFPRIFTLKELVRRGEAIGPRGVHESLTDWLARAHAGRASCDLMGASDADDVPDPIGMPRTAYERMYEELDEQFGRLVPLLWAPQYERSVR